MEKLNASEVAAQLDEIGHRLELAGEESLMRKAYLYSASRTDVLRECHNV